MDDSSSSGSSTPRDISDISPRSVTPQSSPPDPNVAPPQAPPQVQNCDDATHCNVNGITCGGTFRNCPGIDANGFNTTYSNVLHPAGNGLMGFAVRVCDQCVLHDHANPLLQKQHRVREWAGPNTFSGNLAQLCHSCIRDEMRLYWQRVNLNTTLANLPANAAPSLQRVRQWPNMASANQNLCVCHHNAITSYQHHCHRCRDGAFTNEFVNPYLSTEAFLRNKDKAAITGRVRSVVGDPHHNVPQQTINNRMFNQVGRMCLCGGRPKRPSIPEYIGFCMCCSGVKVIAHNIPERYQQVNMVVPSVAGPRRSARNHGASQDRTKGPAKALRSHFHRVNIERGWMQADPLIGST